MNFVRLERRIPHKRREWTVVIREWILAVCGDTAPSEYWGEMLAWAVPVWYRFLRRSHPLWKTSESAEQLKTQSCRKGVFKVYVNAYVGRICSVLPMRLSEHAVKSSLGSEHAYSIPEVLKGSLLNGESWTSWTRLWNLSMRDRFTLLVLNVAPWLGCWNRTAVRATHGSPAAIEF
jgi:hypothetical protein